MILTHFIAFMAQGASLAITVPPGGLPLGDGGTAVLIPRRPLALMPALPVRRNPVLPVRGI